jgi:CAAX protease family protein
MLDSLVGQVDFAGDRANRAAIVAIVAGTILLVLFYWFGRPSGYYATGTADLVGRLTAGSGTDFVGSGAYLWWGLSSLVFRCVVPLGLMWMIAGLRPAELGVQVQGIGKHLWIYIALYAVMFPVLFWASSLDAFQSYYPFYKNGYAVGGAALAIYVVGYALQFVGVEVFFRGFLTFGLAGRFGWWAIVIATIPYVMIHFGKPTPEIFGAFFAGLILSFLALRTQSVVPGIGLHIAIAFTMDLLVVTRT